MSTLTKPRAKPLPKSVPRVKTVTRAKLTPPPAKFASEVMPDYPAPSPHFDADYVASIVACRSDR